MRIEAARLARASGKPVKLVWTREEEFNWAYFRPAGVIEVNSGVKNDGTVTAWEFQNYNSGGSGIQVKYDFPNQDIQFHNSKSPLRRGSYRGWRRRTTSRVKCTWMSWPNLSAWIRTFRLKNIKDARLKAVLEAAAKRLVGDERRLKDVVTALRVVLKRKLHCDGCGDFG